MTDDARIDYLSFAITALNHRLRHMSEGLEEVRQDLRRLPSDVRSSRVEALLGDIDTAQADVKDIEQSPAFGKPAFLVYFQERVGALAKKVGTLAAVSGLIMQMKPTELQAAQILSDWYRQAHLEISPPLPVAIHGGNMCDATQIAQGLLFWLSMGELDLCDLAIFGHGIAHQVIAQYPDILSDAPLVVESLRHEPWAPLPGRSTRRRRRAKSSSSGSIVFGDPRDAFLPLPESYVALSGELYADAIAGYVVGPAYGLSMVSMENRITRLLFYPAAMHNHMAAAGASIPGIAPWPPIAGELFDMLERDLKTSSSEWRALLDPAARLVVHACERAGIVPWFAQSATDDESPVAEAINHAWYLLLARKNSG